MSDTVPAEPASSIVKPHVVYHVAGMGDWMDIVPEQLTLLRETGLHENVRITYLGKDIQWLQDRIAHFGINARIVRQSENTDHCETFAMMEIDQMAKEEKVQRPILYMHTKGVSNPGNQSKRQWRLLMEAWVVRRWRINMNHLLTYDAVGVNWIEGGPQHFSGTFWIANPDWLRKLPKFEDYHRAGGLHRYTCEMWIGAFQWCNALSLGCKNEPFWNFQYDYLRWLPRPGKDVSPDAPPVSSDSPFGQVFDYHGSDKDECHSYGPVYDRLYPLPKRAEVKALLEVGVQSGRSLMAWEKTFPNATVYGMDLEDRLEGIGPRTRAIIADATKPQMFRQGMQRLKIKKGTLDLFIDDGSHRFVDQLATAFLARPFLTQDATLVIEDIYPASCAGTLAEATGGFVLDRRGEKQRFDDVMVIAGRRFEDFEDLHNPVEFDIPSPFPPT